MLCRVLGYGGGKRGAKQMEPLPTGADSLRRDKGTKLVIPKLPGRSQGKYRVQRERVTREPCLGRAREDPEGVTAEDQ